MAATQEQRYPVGERHYKCQECNTKTTGPRKGRQMEHCRACGSRYSLVLESTNVTPPPYDSRLSRRILALAREHKLIASDIARECNCSREFVRLVTEAHGVRPLTGREIIKRAQAEREHAERVRRADFRREWGERVEELFRQTRDPEHIARTLRISYSEVRDYLGDRAGLRRNDTMNVGPPAFTRQEMIEAVQQCAHDLGIPPGGRLSGPKYMDWRNTTPAMVPSQALFYVKEGWRSVVEEAGYKTYPSVRANYSSVSVERAEEAMDQYVTFMLDRGLYPSAAEYEKWYKAQGAPVRAIITRRLGGWAKALQESLIRLDPKGHRQVERASTSPV